jgi:hypothetical protein
MRSVSGVAVALEDAAEAAEQLLQTSAEPARGTPTPAGIAGSVVTAAQLLPLVLPNGRTSTGARQATAALRPHANASSRSAACSAQKPPYGLRSGPGRCGLVLLDVRKAACTDSANKKACLPVIPEGAHRTDPER